MTTTHTDKAGHAWTEPETAEDLTEAMYAAVRDAVEWQDQEARVDWERVWDRTEGATLPDGTRLALPTADPSTHPVYRALKRAATAHRKALT